MVAQSKEEVRLAFARRLNKALDEKAGAEDFRGRRRWVAKQYNVSVESARKWLMGLEMPDRANMSMICADLSVCYDWLFAGVGPMRPVATDSSVSELERLRLSDTQKTRVIEFAKFLKTQPDQPPSGDGNGDGKHPSAPRRST